MIKEPPAGTYKRDGDALIHEGKGNWKWNSHDKDGTVSRSITLQKHVMHGEAHAVYPDGKPRFKANYADGRLHGEVIEYGPDGEVLIAHAEQVALAGQPAAAELIYERATADADWAFQAYRGLTQIRASQGRYEAALESLDKALSLQSTTELEAYRTALQRTLEASR